MRLKKEVPIPVQKAAALFLALLFVWASYTAFCNLHVHRTSDGKVILHSHPYTKPAGDSRGVPGHSHDPRCFVLVDQVRIFFFIFFLLPLFLGRLTPCRRFNPRPLFIALRPCTEGSSITRRGPPSILLNI